MKNLLSLLSLILLSNILFAQTEKVIRINQPNTAQLELIKHNKLEVTSFNQNDYIDLMVNPQWLQKLSEEGISYKITQTHEQNKINLNAQKDIAGYRTYDEVVAELQEIANNYPNICELSDIGDSHGKIYFNEGINGYQDYQHDIWMLKISDNVAETEDEPAVYFMGAHHAREPISTEVVMGIINHLIDGYGNNDEITNMVDASEIYIIPMVNPDGHEVVLDQLNTNWRKNAADGDNNGIFDYESGSVDGVDPNRNYGWNWGGEGSSGDQTAETYRGPEAFSEPETQDMRDLLATHHFTTGISYHSYSELVLWPYAYSETALAPDHLALEELGVNMANSIPKIIGSGNYTPEQSNELYAAAGVTDDWAYGKHGIFCYTVELAQEFIPPSPQVPNIVADNIDAAMMVLNRANHKTLRGHVYDAATLEPIVAEVFIEEIDGIESFRESYKSNAQFGSYYRLLPLGENTATFSAYGYIPQTIENIAITEDEATILDVYLEKAQTSPVFGSVIDGSNGENIEGAQIEFLNTPLLPVLTNPNGVYQLEEVAYNTYQVKVSKEAYSSIILQQEITDNQYILNFVLMPSEAISFEEDELEEFSFEGNQDWTIDFNESHSGSQSAVSGNITDNQSSTMILEIEDSFAGELSFYKKVSSESGWDFLKFYIDGIEKESWSGEEDWSKSTYNLSSGAHSFKWSYIKDGNTSNGSDQAWVDDIELPTDAVTLVNAGPDLEICHDGHAQLNAYAANYETVQWSSLGDGTFENNTHTNTNYSPGVEDIANGVVNLQITANGENESVSDEMLLAVETCLGIDELVANDFRISPNPAKDLFSIEFDGNDLKEVRIFHISGQLMQKIMLASHQQNIQLNANTFDSGVYIVKVINNQGWAIAKKLIIE